MARIKAYDLINVSDIGRNDASLIETDGGTKTVNAYDLISDNMKYVVLSGNKSLNDVSDPGVIYRDNSGAFLRYGICLVDSTGKPKMQFAIRSDGSIKYRSWQNDAWDIVWTDTSQNIPIERIQQAVENYLREHPIASGKSAYEIALEEGYQGTKAEWLTSLKGLKGKSITDANVDKYGILSVTFEEEKEINGEIMIERTYKTLGFVKGSTGDRGDKGESIVDANIDADGNLILTHEIYAGDYTAVGFINAGHVVGPDGAPGAPGTPGADYVLTEEDKNRIAELAAAKVIVQADTLADCVEPDVFYIVENDDYSGLPREAVPPYKVSCIREFNGDIVRQYIFDHAGHIYTRLGILDETVLNPVYSAIRIATIDDIPSKTSDLENDSGFITAPRVAKLESQYRISDSFSMDLTGIPIDVLSNHETIDVGDFGVEDANSNVYFVYISADVTRIKQGALVRMPRYLPNLIAVYVDRDSNEVEIVDPDTQTQEGMLGVEIGAIGSAVEVYYKGNFHVFDHIVNGMQTIKTQIPTQISQLYNDVGYLLSSGVKSLIAQSQMDYYFAIYDDNSLHFDGNGNHDVDKTVGIYFPERIKSINVAIANTYPNLTTVYINNLASDVSFDGGEFPSTVAVIYREQFHLEQLIIKALSQAESTSNKVTSIASGSTNTQYPSAKAVYTIVSKRELTSHKVTTITSSSTDTQYPSAKAVYTSLSDKSDKSDTYTKSEVDSLVSGGVVPQYVIDESESVLAKAFAHKGLGRTIRFIAVSDSHNDATEASYAYTRVSNQHCGQAVKYIADRIPLDFVAYLGDMTWAGVAHTTAQYQTDWLKEDIQEMNLFLKDGFSGVPNIRVVGNHDQCATTDSGGTVSRLQNSGAYQYFGRYNAGVSDGLSNYGYYDLNNVKVRIVYLNTSDAVNVSSQGTYLAITAAQKNWLCETLIDLNTKTDAASWKILLMSHAPLDMVSGLAADILIPYINGGSYGSYTFTNHSAKIIGNCHGHTHCYNVGYISDTIRRFTIPNSNFYDNNHYKNNANYAAWTEETTYPKTQNSRTDTSFSLVTIDLDNLTCYVDNYGAGYDRNFSVDYKKTVSSISNLSYTGTTTVGQNIDTSAISYTVNYSDGSTSSRTGNVTVSPVTIQQVGNNAITVSYTENGTTVTGNLTIAGTAPPVVRLLDLDRTEATAAVDALIPFDTTKYYTNIAYSTVKGYGTNCTVYSKSSDSISLKESGTGGITVGYPVELPDTSSSYTFSCDYNGTGRARIYYRLFDSSGTSNTSTTPYITNDTSATGSVTATIAAPGGNYKWLIIMFGSNTAGEKEYTNVSLTKDS